MDYQERLFQIKAKDISTFNHCCRVGRIARLFATILGKSEDEILQIEVAGYMHDVGKLTIPDEILCKAGMLGERERSIIQTHSEKGNDLLTDAPRIIREAAYFHHVKYDGGGYPAQELKGKDIPEVARIIAIVDVFEALTAERVYKKAMPINKAVALVKEGAGSSFDDELLNVFLEKVIPSLGSID